MPQDNDNLKPAKKRWGKWRMFFVLLFLFGTLFLATLGGVLFVYLNELPGLETLARKEVALSTKMYDIHGELITQLAIEERTLIDLDQIPQNLINAFIAIEDNRFYEHWGVDLWGIARAMWVNFQHKKMIQGGSTITQQLAKNMFLTRERTLRRKVKEALLAVQLERQLTKDEILTEYMNLIYFGNRAYGVEAASRKYFGKHVEDLSLGETAVLAGIPRSPNRNNPISNIEHATARRDVVLKRMASPKLNFISAEEFAAAVAEPIEVYETEVGTAPYFVEYVRKKLENTYGSNMIYKGGLKVYTTLDLSLQDYAQRAVNKGLRNVDKMAEPYLTHLFTLKERPVVQAAFLAMDPHNGHIRAMVGGRDFQKYQFNRAVQARRQPGSAFKPFIYTAAIDNGFTAADVILDTPFVIKNPNGTIWKPENFCNCFKGETTLRRGLTKSKNVVTVKLLQKLGTLTAINYAHRMGITSKLNRDLTLGLGTGEVSLLEMVRGFSTLANMGVRVKPMAILRVVDQAGKTLEEHVPEAQEVLAASTAYITTTILEDVVNYGTGRNVRRLGYTGKAAGKTGTTNDFGDAWFMGYTPDLVAGVWFGYDQRRAIGRNLTGGKVAAPVWTEFMIRASQGKPQRDFPIPDTIVTVPVCAQTGDTCLGGCRKVIQEIFAEGTEPTPCEEEGSELIDFWNKDLKGTNTHLSKRIGSVSGSAKSRNAAIAISPAARSPQGLRIAPVKPPSEDTPASAF